MIASDKRRPTLIIMAKAPFLGHGKSRLAKDLGAVQALRVNRWLHRRTLSNALVGPWQVVLAVAPRKALCIRLPGVWPPPSDISRVAQAEGDLSARIAGAVGPFAGPVCVIGTDAPGLSRRLLLAAFKALRRGPAVLGPAADGGFWLVGAERSAELIKSLSGVRWSTPYAGADIAARLPGPVQYLPHLIDVDDGPSWRAVQRPSIAT
jgi:uncharacterized protein